LRVLGATRPQRRTAEIAATALVTFFAASVAVVVAFALSPLSPVGTARDAEPHPGFAFDWSLYFAGFVVLFAGTVLAALVAIVRTTSRRDLPGRETIETQAASSRLGDLAGRTGLGAP